MAYSDYGVRWQLRFAARDGKMFRVEILQDGWNDTPINLRGAASPIETQEDNSQDPFYPIRKQTGTLRIADNGYDMDGNTFNYDDMIPGDTYDNQVRLWQEGGIGESDTLRWVGYMRPDSLTSRMFEKISIREFPLVCPIGAMYDKPLTLSNNETNKNTVKTIGQILHDALASTDIDWQYVYKQNNVSNREDLTAKVSLMNFIENKPTHTTDSQNNVYATWTDNSTSYGNVIEEICQFFGWVLYSRGLDIYIVARNDNAKFAQFAFADLNSESTQSLPYINDVFVDLEDDVQYASVNHSTMRIPGYRNVTVEANVNQHQTVINPELNKIASYVWWPSNPGVIHQDQDQGGTIYMYVVKRLGSSTTNRVYIDNYEVYENRVLSVGGTNTVDFVTIIYDGWKADDYSVKSEFNFKYGVCAWIGGFSNINKTFWIKTLEDVIIPKNSAICIQASAVPSYNPAVEATSGSQGGVSIPSIGVGESSHAIVDRYVVASLRIGNKYYKLSDGTWVDYESNFGLYVRSDGSITRPTNEGSGQVESGILWDNHAGSKGFVLYSGEGLCGRMTLSIYAVQNSSSTSHELNFVLDGLNVTVINEDNKSKPINTDSHKYEDIASSNFSRNLDVSLKLASGIHNKYGLGQLMTVNLNLLNTIPYFNVNTQAYEDLQPEQHLLKMLKNQYNNVTTINTIEVMDNIQASLPNVIYDNLYRLLSCSHDWREGTMQLTMTN